MLIRSIQNYNLSFHRKLKDNEKEPYKKALQQGKEFLGVENVAMIIHGSCYPSLGRDSNIGSPYSAGAFKLIEFEKLHGFNSNQLGPVGKISNKDFSPYESKVFSKNNLFIDLYDLTQKEYACILSPETYNNVTYINSIKNANYNMTNFYEAFENYDIALNEAYFKFKSLLKTENSDALRLNDEFIKFKAENGNRLFFDGVFKVLSNIYKTEEFEKWDSKIDRDLIGKIQEGDPAAQKRLDFIVKRSGNKIEKNSFIQFLADKQIQEKTKQREELNFKYINDLLVGFSNSELWANQRAFLKGYKLGCPYGGYGNGPQVWEIPVLDPKKLFNEDGSLGIAGQLLSDKIDYALKYFDNIRVDHVLGLVDPYICKEDSVVIINKVVQRDKLEADNISNLPEIDPSGNYKKILKEVVIPIMEKHGLNPQDAVWEDLCTKTSVFSDIFYDELNLPGITQLEWRRGEYTPFNYWALVGSHDSIPAIHMDKTNAAWNTDYLAGFLNADPKHAEQKEIFKRKIQQNPTELLKAKFAELFRTSKNIQISFSDFFGIDKVYNYGGQKNKSNWKLRLNNDFEDTYHKNLQSKNPTAINMPEVIAMAVRAKIDMLVAKLNDENPQEADIMRKDLEKQNKPLLDELDKYAEILKEN